MTPLLSGKAIRTQETGLNLTGFTVNDSGYPPLTSSSNIDGNTGALGHHLNKLGQ